MGGLNKAMLIGNLGKDPEVKTLDNGAKIATFPLATTETYKDRDGNKQSRTEWHNIVLWRGLADVAEMYCRKGGQVYIEGRLSTRKWDDKDGHTRYTTEIIGDNMVLLSRSDSTSGSAHPPKPTAPGDLGSVDRSSDAVNDLPY
ncbi:MAG: single-stranded DNA-binding protein [Bacteroidota bacterium]|jgi:single-strand DNA-binding protein|nr:single-stranded DNA-binding protein [Bacteroidota bacterium]